MKTLVKKLSPDGNGGKVVTVDDNLRLDDSGRIVYGCQVWWEPVE